jgi:choline kinase
MQAAIMAAGRGNRLRDAYDGMPKGMIKISGKPIIDWTLSYFREAGVDNVYMTVGYKKNVYEKHLNGQGVNFVYNPFYDHGQILSSFWFLRNELDPAQDMLYCHADTIVERELVRKMNSADGDIILPYDSSLCNDESMKVALSNGSIGLITKQMSCTEADGEFVGFAKISSRAMPALLECCEELISDGKLESYFEDALQLMHDRKGYVLTALDIAGLDWVEIDFPEDLARARKLDLK